MIQLPCRFTNTDCYTGNWLTPVSLGLITEKLSMHIGRDGFRERGALGHFSFWGPTQM